MTEAAKAAKALKKELKAKYPDIKFSVVSTSFANGNSVRVEYKNGVPEDKIRAIADKYQYGSFDGMTDSYNLDNVRDDVPQAKYVSVCRAIDQEIKERTARRIADDYRFDCDDVQAWHRVFKRWKDQVVWQRLRNETL